MVRNWQLRLSALSACAADDLRQAAQNTVADLINLPYGDNYRG
jgi:hypothetical protein